VIRIGRQQVWDIAAPVLMVQEAGGLVTDENLAPLQFRDGKIDYRYVIASNRHVHHELIEMVLEQRSEPL
jgi:3'-phosphoadenosine 5'-phosphosulfate (PAPS) 3'-phosphatase